MSTAKQVSKGQPAPDVTPEAMPEVTPEAAVKPEVTPEAAPSVSHLAVTAWPANVAEASQPVLDWWMHHWMDASHPLSRLQRVWMESVLEAIEVEAEFLNACALSNAKVWSCIADANYLPDTAALHGCYHEAAKDIAEAHMTRLGKVAELPEDFKQRLWEEIC